MSKIESNKEQKPNYHKAVQIAAAMTPHEEKDVVATVEHKEVFTKKEEAELEDNLKGLGYI